MQKKSTRAGMQKINIFKNTKDRMSIIVDVCVLWQLMATGKATSDLKHYNGLTRMIGQLNVTESAEC